MGKYRNKSTAKYCYIDPDLAWEYIETGRDTDGLYPEYWNTKYKLPKSYLLQGEKYQILGGNVNDYALTSLGRLFSLKHQTPKQMIPYIFTYTVSVPIRDTRINITNRLKDMGWEKNAAEVYDIYMTYRWKFYVIHNDGTHSIYNDIKDEEE